MKTVTIDYNEYQNEIDMAKIQAQLELMIELMQIMDKGVAEMATTVKNIRDKWQHVPYWDLGCRLNTMKAQILAKLAKMALD